MASDRRRAGSQVDAVVQTMARNGGFATLRYLYTNTPTSGWRTMTPFASIRRIVQVSAQFFKVKPGLWALEAYRDRLPADIQRLARERDSGGARPSDASHGYYQGLAAELGSLKGFTTYVPAQDGNRLCAGRKLRDIASCTTLPAFTYERVLRSARMIDVIWFNRRGYPASLLEVEHTTDFRGAFEKFAEMVDFRCDMCVIADRVRKRQFRDVAARTAYSTLSGQVRFLDYDNLAELHAATGRLARAEHAAGLRQ